MSSGARVKGDEWSLRMDGLDESGVLPFYESWIGAHGAAACSPLAGASCLVHFGSVDEWVVGWC